MIEGIVGGSTVQLIPEPTAFKIWTVIYHLWIHGTKHILEGWSHLQREYTCENLNTLVPKNIVDEIIPDPFAYGVLLLFPLAKQLAEPSGVVKQSYVAVVVDQAA